MLVEAGEARPIVEPTPDRPTAYRGSVPCGTVNAVMDSLQPRVFHPPNAVQDNRLLLLPLGNLTFNPQDHVESSTVPHHFPGTMSVPESKYLSPVWRDGIFKDRVVFVTGGAGNICSMQTRALVRLGANACIIGRNVEKTEAAAKDIATARPGAKVIGIGSCDVRKVESLQAAADRCAKELGGIDFVIAGAAGNFISPIDKLSPNAFKSVIDIDVLGTFNTIKSTMPHTSRRPKRPSTRSWPRWPWSMAPAA
ncbi:hypothetical protein G7046_g9420 [Stylonectria norvegica]|nr:hypothetical protein G7046_g9420 [Stylonectria norvegica]